RSGAQRAHRRSHDPRADGGGRARPHLGAHVAEGADRRGGGARDGGHHAARGDPRRRGGAGPGRHVRQLGQGARAADRAGPGDRPVAALPARRRRRRGRGRRGGAPVTDHIVRRGEAAEGPFSLVITPKTAARGYSSLRILELEAGGSATFATGEDEAVVLPLEGGCTVTCDGQEFTLTGRRNVFSRVTDFAYVPRDAEVTVSSSQGGRVALPAARATRRLEPRYGPAESVSVELRGAGQSSRQVNNFCIPATFHAQHLIRGEGAH